MKQGVLELVAWPILGDPIYHKEFLHKLLTSSCPPGGQRLKLLVCQIGRLVSARGRNPTAGPVNDIVNFVAELYDQGYQYCSLNSYHLVISSVHSEAHVNGCPVGQHPLVSQMLKGVFNNRPTLPILGCQSGYKVSQEIWH